ncbi:MAG: GerMN domain-containing protein [Bacillota bacterium]
MNGLMKNRTLCYVAVAIMLTFLLVGCTKPDTITFTAEIESVNENSILVNTIDYENFDKASVDLRDAEYDFELSEGQTVEITILPEIRESYPVQVTGVKLTLIKEVGIADYFPIEDNTKYVYEGMGNEFASFNAFVDYTSENKAQQMIDNGGSALARVYEIKDGKLIRTFSKGEVYYRENFLDQNDMEEILLMEPLKEGTTWTIPGGYKRTITDTSKEVETPMGTYTAIEVTTEQEDGRNTDYYAKDIGLVKTSYRSGDMEVSSTLKSIEKNAARVQSVNFYYPDVQDDKISYISKDITYQTNDSTSQLLEDAYKQAVNETYGVVLSTGAAIKSLTLDNENKVRIDLNNTFVSEMNAGSGYESMILQCIANTFGQYYNSGEVILTVEGKPNESGHFKMEEGQSIPVKYDGISEES